MSFQFRSAAKIKSHNKRVANRLEAKQEAKEAILAYHKQHPEVSKTKKFDLIKHEKKESKKAESVEDRLKAGKRVPGLSNNIHKRTDSAAFKRYLANKK